MTIRSKLILSRKNLLKFFIKDTINASRRKTMPTGTAEGKKIKPIKKNNLPVCFNLSSLKDSNNFSLRYNTIFNLFY